MWSSKCLLQVLWGATAGQEKEWQETLTGTLSKLSAGQTLVSKQIILNSILLLTLHPGVWPYSQGNTEASLPPRIQLCTSPRSRWEFDCGVQQNSPLFVTSGLYPLRASVGCSSATLVN